MIARTTFVWFYSFNSTCHIVPVVLFITQERKVIQTHMSKVKIKTPKEDWKLKIYPIDIHYKYTLTKNVDFE